MLDIIIVLGNSNEKVTTVRLERAIEEFKKQVERDDHDIFERNKLILVTGTKEEADFMTEYILSKNIDRKFILVEDQSKNTIDNAQNSLVLISNHLLLPSRITVCTSTFHLPRTIVIFNIVFARFANMLDFIHTRENIDDAIQCREKRLIWSTLNLYMDNMCK